MSYSVEQTEQLLQQLHQEARTFFTRPLSLDWFCLFADAKLIDLKDDQDHVRPAVHFLVLGIGMDGKKQMLLATTFWGNEVLEAWRQVLINLKNRGLTRALLWVTDDFSGLTGLLQGLFPHSYHQLCTVHLQRNAHRHLSPEDYATFKNLWKERCAASSPESAQAKFCSLLEALRPRNKAWVEHVEKRSAHNLVFLHFPASLRAQLRSTNLPEGINNQIENLRRNAGGHFHSEREALIKMKLLTDQLYQTKWRRASPTITAQLACLNRLFQQRFEAELDPLRFLTQCLGAGPRTAPQDVHQTGSTPTVMLQRGSEGVPKEFQCRAGRSGDGFSRFLRRRSLEPQARPAGSGTEPPCPQPAPAEFRPIRGAGG